MTDRTLVNGTDAVTTGPDRRDVRAHAYRLVQSALAWLGRGYRAGQLRFRLPDGVELRLGDGEPQATIRLHKAATLLRFLRHPELALGETYMAGDWDPEDDDLLRVLEVCLRNQTVLERARSPAVRGAWHWWHELSGLARSRRNVQHHYDRDPRLYQAFLDAGLHYSCAYFERPELSLEAAQEAKCALIARKLDLRPGARVLDIGCGFGGLALYLAERHGVQVTGITLAAEQWRIAQERARTRGLAGQVEFRLEDYRQIQGHFDAVVSVGMFEHVGRPQYRLFFQRVRELLAPDGVALIHSIGRSSPPSRTNPWINRYIFPGGYIPAASEVMSAIETSGLILSDFEIWREHYARTLAAWHARFQDGAAALHSRFDARFCRMWRFYLQGCEASFRWGDLVVFQIQLLADKNRLPITRDYLYTPTEEHALPHGRSRTALVRSAGSTSV